MFIQLLQEDPRQYFAVVISVVISIILHELAHGWVAIRHGDDTPIESGHMTASPLVHMGPIAILCLLLSGITWGQMPIDRTRLRGRYAEALVAIAGPAMNFLLAVLALTGLGLWQRYDDTPTAMLSAPLQNVSFLLGIFGVWNLILGLLNLLPVPPLDGYHVMSSLSRPYAQAMDRIAMSGGSLILLLIVFVVFNRPIQYAAGEGAIRFLTMVRGF